MSRAGGSPTAGLRVPLLVHARRARCRPRRAGGGGLDQGHGAVVLLFGCSASHRSQRSRRCSCACSKAAGRRGPTLASSLNIAAFNLGNALGAWAGGVTIDRGLGLGALPLVAAVITAVGLLLALWSLRLDRRRCAGRAVSGGMIGITRSTTMEYRNLGTLGFRKSPCLSFGTGTFGGQGPLFSAWGRSDASEARRLIDICLEAGVNLFDTADVYSNGASEEILGAAIKGRRDKVLISTKTGLPMGEGPLDAGTSRHRLVAAVDAALRRLGTDYIDLLQLHAFDAFTPVDEVLSTLDTLVRAGKLRYVGASNFSGWHLMKSLGDRRAARLAALCGAPGLLFAGRP